jgi:hypothetical protein
MLNSGDLSKFGEKIAVTPMESTPFSKLLKIEDLSKFVEQVREDADAGKL